ncbi:long-chain fatty acid--CoA ligase [Pigmentiphaga soli]|uniref:Long-chain fatty acid--CoA ligase n=1 Tax=Pigmentiphaga soli TaxID=1007095 RepID=A0ABP8GST7_9BURK
MHNDPQSIILGDAFLRNARYFRDKTAFIDSDGACTHGQFADRVIRLINALSRLGIARQGRLAVLSANSRTMIEIAGAAELGGFIVLPLNHRLAAAELSAICLDAQPGVLFYQSAFAETAARIAEETGTPAIRIDGEAGEAIAGAPGYEALLRAETSAQLARQASADDGVHLVYTSGTTGRPKGVLLGQRGQVEMTRTMAASGGIRAGTRLLLVMPLFHVGGKSQQLCCTWHGGTVIVRPRFSAAQWFDLIQAHRVTVAHLAPVMIRSVLDEPERGHDLSSLETISYGSSPIPQRDLARAVERFGPIFIQYYGMTETGPLNTMLDKEFHQLSGRPEGDARLGSAGYPHIGGRIEIRDAEGRACPDGTAGEVYIDTPTLMIGYWNRELGRADPVPRGWFATGDVGYVGRDDALLYLIDRKKDMIVSGGENIYSREVEEALHAHPAVREAAVVGVPDEHWGETVAAYVVFREGAAATAEELVAHCRLRLAGYKKPRHIYVVDSLPRLAATGKIDKKRLRARHWGPEGRFVA